MSGSSWFGCGNSLKPPGSPLKIAPTIFPLFKLYGIGRGDYANYFQLLRY
jgi:hypothetical protein